MALSLPPVIGRKKGIYVLLPSRECMSGMTGACEFFTTQEQGNKFQVSVRYVWTVYLSGISGNREIFIDVS